MGYSKHALGFDSIKDKYLFNKIVCEVYLIKSYQKNMLEEICKGTFEYSYLGIRSIKRTLQIKRSRLKEKKKH